MAKVFAVLGLSIPIAVFGFALWFANVEFGEVEVSWVQTLLAFSGVLLFFLSPLWAWLLIFILARSEKRARLQRGSSLGKVS